MDEYQQSILAAFVSHSLPDRIVVIQSDGEIIWLNSAWKAFAQENQASTSTTSVGANYLEVLKHAADSGSEMAGHVLDGITGVITGSQENFQFEYPCHSSNAKSWFLMWAGPLESSEEQSFLITHRDITNQKIAEFALEDARKNLDALVSERTQALQENEALLQSIFDNVPVGLLIKNANHVIERVNKTYLSWYGATEEDLIGNRSDSVENFQSFQDTAIMNAQEQQVLDLGTNTHRLVEREFADGAVHSVFITKFPVHDQSGRITRVGSVSIDWTDEIEAKESLSRSENRLRYLLEIAPEAIVAVDGDHKIQLFNKGAERIFGYQAGDIIGQSMNVLIPHRLRKSHSAHVDKFVQSTDPYLFMDQRTEISGLRKDGTEFPAAASVSQMNFEGEQMFLVLLIDMTERKEAREALRTAVEEADKANKAKSEFLAAMSHDLRTPLNAILGFAEIITHQIFGPIEKKYQEYAQDISSSGEHLLSLVDKILDLTAIEMGKENLQKETLNVPAIIADCRNIIRFRADERNIDLRIEVPNDGLTAFADLRSLKQILLNLLSNAIKFSPEGSRVALVAKEAGPTVSFSVIDQGAGIPESDLSWITDPFARGDRDPYKAKDSWGLGLAIVTSLVDLNDGEFSIQSTPGKGTTVSVSFPKHDGTRKGTN